MKISCSRLELRADCTVQGQVSLTNGAAKLGSLNGRGLVFSTELVCCSIECRLNWSLGMEKSKEILKFVASKVAKCLDWQCKGSVVDMLQIAPLIVIALRVGRSRRQLSTTPLTPNCPMLLVLHGLK